MSKKPQQKKGAKKKGAAVKGIEGGVRLANHPRAQRSIARTKSYAGLAAFLFAGYARWNAGGQFLDVATTALVWGAATYVLVWALAVQVWRQLAVAEVRAAQKKWEERQQAKNDQVAKLTQVLEDSGMPTTGTGAPPAA